MGPTPPRYPSNSSQHIPSTLPNWQRHLPQTPPFSPATSFPFLAPTPPSATWLRHPAPSNALRCLPVPRPLTHFRAARSSPQPPGSAGCLGHQRFPLPAPPPLPHCQPFPKPSLGILTLSSPQQRAGYGGQRLPGRLGREDHTLLRPCVQTNPQTWCGKSMPLILALGR